MTLRPGGFSGRRIRRSLIGSTGDKPGVSRCHGRFPAQTDLVLYTHATSVRTKAEFVVIYSVSIGVVVCGAEEDEVNSVVRDNGNELGDTQMQHHAVRSDSKIQSQITRLGHIFACFLL